MPDSTVCPHCGGDRFAGPWADRTCAKCGHTLPTVAGDGRRGRPAALWLIFTISCLVVAFGSVLLVVEGDGRGALGAVGTVLLLLSITAAVFGAYFCLRTVLVAPVVFVPGTPGRLLPADRAVAIVREVALLRRAIHITKQLDGIRPGRP
jgi:hypothetical protein